MGLFFALGALAFLQIFTGAQAYRNTRQLREDAAWVSHTHEVLQAVQACLTTVIDAETGERGYLLTHDRKYLQPYQEAARKARERLQRVEGLVKDNGPEVIRTRALKGLIKAKLGILDQSLALQAQDPEAALRLLRTGQGKELMDSLRRQVEAIQGEEQALLAARERNSRRGYRAAVLSGAVFFMLGLGMTTALLLLFLRHHRERTQYEQALEQQRLWLHVTLHSIGDGLITTDGTGRVTLMNPAASRMTGWDPEQAAGKPLGAVFPLVNEQTGEPAASPLDRVLREGVTMDLVKHSALVAKGGRVTPVEDSAAPILDASGRVAGMVLVFHDIVERRRQEEEKAALEAQLQEARQRETLGVLAGGIAHDFNNLLTTILGNANLGHLVVETGSKAADCLKAIEKAAVRAGELTSQMLAYAGKGRFWMREVDLNIVLKEIVQLLGAPHAQTVAIQCDLGEIPFVKGDSTQLSQVMGILITNAAEACGPGAQGPVFIRTRAEELDEAAIQDSPWVLPAAPGSYVTLEVGDRGVGMTPEVLARAFEPFFTTKFMGRGLGLAAALGIIRSHGGGLRVWSESGQGSSFKVFLPAWCG
jgi:PAS domain S-box-containing protein